MLRLIKDLPSHVTGLHAYHEVTEEEYVRELRKLLYNAVQMHGKINYILVLETEIRNFASGMWCGNVGIGLKHFFKWNKVAIVSDQRGLRGYSDLFKYILPGRFKMFPLIRMDEAIIWVSRDKQE
jgi:hypothetical protein